MNSTILYTVNAICSYHDINEEMLSDMVSWGIATPYGTAPNRWLFSQNDYERIGCATRFNKDLDINIPGAAMVLELLEELDKVRIEIRR